MPVVIVHDAGFPQRVKLFRISADLHLDAGHTVRIFSVRQITPTSIAMPLHALCCAGLPRHSRYQHRGRSVDRRIQLKVQSHILGLAHGHIGNAGNLGPVENIVIIVRVAVRSRILATLTHANSRAHEEICPLRFRHEHSLYSSFRHSRAVLVIIDSAALQLAAVAQRPMAQPPLGQNILLVAVSPQGIISGNLTSHRDSCVGACPRHRGQSSTAGHSTLGIFAAKESRVPCQPAATLIRGHIASHRIIAAALEGAERVIQVCAILPLLQHQGQSEAVNGCGFAGKIKPGFTLNCQHVHRAIFQGQRIGANVPCERILFRPVCGFRAGVSQKRSRFTPVCQIIQRGAGVITTHIITVEANGVGFAASALCEHFRKAFQTLILRHAITGRQRPPAPEDFCGIFAIQQTAECCIHEFRTGSTSSNACQNVILAFHLSGQYQTGFIGQRMIDKFPCVSHFLYPLLGAFLDEKRQSATLVRAKRIVCSSSTCCSLLGRSCRLVQQILRCLGSGLAGLCTIFRRIRNSFCLTIQFIQFCC